MNWKAIWLNMFGNLEFAGLNMGFWASMGVVALIVILMNIIFWCMRPKKTVETKKM